MSVARHHLPLGGFVYFGGDPVPHDDSDYHDRYHDEGSSDTEVFHRVPPFSKIDIKVSNRDCQSHCDPYFIEVNKRVGDYYKRLLEN